MEFTLDSIIITAYMAAAYGSNLLQCFIENAKSCESLLAAEIKSLHKIHSLWGFLQEISQARCLFILVLKQIKHLLLHQTVGASLTARPSLQHGKLIPGS